MAERRKVLIAGSGPAGLTAAVYSARAQLAPVVIEGEPSSTSDQPGGQLMLTTEVENYPGFPDGVLGPELMRPRCGPRRPVRRRAAHRQGQPGRPVGSPVRRVGGRPEAGDPTYEVEALIVATGAQSLMLGVPGEDRLLGPRRVDLCHLRRLLLPGPGHRGGGRRGLGARRGAVPHPLRQPR